MLRATPHGSFEDGGGAGVEDRAAAELLMRRLQNLMDLSGVASLKLAAPLPGGGYAVAYNMGGVRKTIIHAPADEPPALNLPDVPMSVPLFISGAVSEPVLAPGVAGPRIRMTQACLWRFAGYDPERAPPAQNVRWPRFDIDYAPAVQELRPTNPEIHATQYAAHHPTWYSGSFAAVAQIAAGYGKKPPPMRLPGSVTAPAAAALQGVRLPGYAGVPAEDGQVRGDYKATNTHGVSFDTENNPWLVRVNNRGVFVMPLPLVPTSTLPAFRAYVEGVNDAELLAVLDRFGGIPTGEVFPANTADFEAWRRAGVIIRVCDTADFYARFMYSPACGWSFAAHGREAANTCYDYTDDGIGYGLFYKLTLRLGVAPQRGWLKGLPNLAQDDRRQYSAYLALVGAGLGKTSSEHAAAYKLRRVTPEQLAARARGFDRSRLAAELQYWRDLEAPPIAVHSGSVREVGRGNLYDTRSFLCQPQIKFADPFEGGCVSFDFLPLPKAGRDWSHPPLCDTVMYAYYIGNDLKTVKYFYDARTTPAQEVSDYEPCMIVGSWTRTVSSTDTRLVGHFYLSDIDERSDLAEESTTTRVVGRDRGYDSKPWFAFDNPFWRTGTLWRNRYFTHTIDSVVTRGQTKALAVCLPMLHRNAALHAKQENTLGRDRSRSTTLWNIPDPNQYRFWTNDFLMHWIGGLPVMRGTPYPRNASPVWVEQHVYTPGACSDFADRGPWIGGLPADYTWLVHPTAGTYPLQGGGGAPRVANTDTSSSEGPTEKRELKMSVLPQPALIPGRPDGWYFTGSPDPFMGVFYRAMSSNAMGTTEYACVTEPGEFEGQLAKQGYSTLVDNRAIPYFIGVVNE